MDKAVTKEIQEERGVVGTRFGLTGNIREFKKGLSPTPSTEEGTQQHMAIFTRNLVYVLPSVCPTGQLSEGSQESISNRGF